MALDPATAQRLAHEAEEAEQGITFSVLASRPTGRPLAELVLEHQDRQRRLRTLATIINLSSTGVALVFLVVARDVISLRSLLMITGGLALIASALMIAMGLIGRSFDRRLRARA